MTATEHQRRWRRTIAREKKLENPKLKEKQERRAEREAEHGAKIKALPKRRYGVIYADPEWRFEPWSRWTGMDRAADNHFSTSFLSIIKARPVQAIAAKDCVLFLWSTIPMFIAAHEVMADWGFEYKSHVVWAKPDMGTGYWVREKHEVLMIGTRGTVPAPAPGEQWPSVIKAPRGKRHSAKPERFAKMIEKLYPTVPKLELNRRGPARKGWDAWGAEAEG